MACENSDESTAALVTAMAGPMKVKGDAGEVEQYPLSDRIAADKYLAGKCATTSARRGLRFTRLIPEGTVNRD